MLSIVLITIINLLSALGIGFYLKKIIQGSSIVLPQLAPIEPVRLALTGFQDRIANSNLDLSDPRFVGVSDEVGTVDMLVNSKVAAEQSPDDSAVPEGEGSDQ